ncbi:MAG: hypothetical protein Q7S01_06530 [bacterium]|nr:hypothetical protein [bacterium]
MNLDSRKIAAALSFALAMPLIAFAQGSASAPTADSQAPQTSDIFSFVLDKGIYTWGDPITIILSLSPEGEQAEKKSALLFDADIKNTAGVACAVITKDHPVRSEAPVLQPFPTEKDSYKFVLPNRKGCAGPSTVNIALKTQDNSQVAITSVPVSMLESATAPTVWTDKPLIQQKDTTSSIPIIPTAILLFAALCVAGYVAWRKKRYQ